jgi:zinc/manganese transport system permease protein
MTLDAATFGILWPAFVAGLLVTATHVPLGMQVLARGIVFIDLAVAQVAGLGVILAHSLGWEPTGAAVQVAALASALACAMLLTWTERRWPEVQEAIIGVVFVLGSSAAILLLAHDPRGGENLKDLLVGQILWVTKPQLLTVAAIYSIVLALWFGLRERIGRIGFYMLFGCVVTVSVQLVGLYLVREGPKVSKGLFRRRDRLCRGPARLPVAGPAIGLDGRLHHRRRGRAGRLLGTAASHGLEGRC